ncbi:MAG: DUF4332 domain-containing protein [Anaerolineales bacterium]|nr:MAG: DUF4332 domain-containing protein [Anaerolineales bacterium]
MADPYYINLENYSLERFQHTLKTGEVLPARQILKENIEERFEVLASMGLRNLGDLIAALKTKQKIEVFAQQSGLPKEYLVIMGREAKSFIPKPVYLREIPGVEDEFVEKLEAVGITHSKHLFKRGQTKAERDKLSAATGIPVDSIVELVKLSDLARVRGIGPVFVRLFYQTGADTIEKLSKWDPEKLFMKADAVNQEEMITQWVPPLKDFEQYVEMAGDLAKVIEYE